MMAYTIPEYPVRIQIACHHVLVAEVIVKSHHEADRLMRDWSNLRYKRNKPMGGACIQRADIKRLWDIPVGSTIPFIEA
jgi:hypothetical protein